jgi:DoxX
MPHVIQNALTMLHAGEWAPVTAARVLIGIFFCISGGTKLFVPAQFRVLEQTMVQSHIPFPHANALFVATVEFACGGLPGGAAHAAVCRNARGRHDRRDRHQSDPQNSGERRPRLDRRLPVPARGAVHIDPHLADLLWAGSIRHRWPYRVASRRVRP